MPTEQRRRMWGRGRGRMPAAAGRQLQGGHSGATAGHTAAGGSARERARAAAGDRRRMADGRSKSAQRQSRGGGVVHGQGRARALALQTNRWGHPGHNLPYPLDSLWSWHVLPPQFGLGSAASCQAQDTWEMGKTSNKDNTWPKCHAVTRPLARYQWDPHGDNVHRRPSLNGRAAIEGSIRRLYI